MPTILLSYDIEEFDMPFEYGGRIDFEEQLAITTEGLHRLLAILYQYGIRCTFYCTAQYALHRKSLVQELHARGFEIASHGYYHSQFNVKDLLASKLVLEEIISSPVYGYRMARMMPLDETEVEAAGYIYNSSLNPTWLPGRYNNLDKPRTVFTSGKLVQLPASVTPFFRIPLFWLSFHSFPLAIYLHFCKQVLQKDDYANLYFHPWEFVDFARAGNATYPAYVTRNSGVEMVHRTEQLIQWAIKNRYSFATTHAWLQQQTML
ncbi:MAG: polysaccharide deacetylase family protein [Chitinophagaceae bacterium]